MKSFLIRDILSEPGNGSQQHQQHQHQHQHQQHQHHHHHQQQQASGSSNSQNQAFQLNSPLDALFQMTSNTFDVLKRGDKRKAREAEQHGSTTNFTSKQTSKKKRKSRTAFTNNQIYELERRFRMQKYLSPTDRDEIALSLNLSNAQVITWFQNRRAKMKRDLEEQKRDIETASLLNLHKTFLESLQALTQMNSAITTDSICMPTSTSIKSDVDNDNHNHDDGNGDEEDDDDQDVDADGDEDEETNIDEEIDLD